MGESGYFLYLVIKYKKSVNREYPTNYESIMDNSRAKQIYQSDQKKQLIYDALTAHEKLTSAELVKATGLDKFHSINTAKRMIEDGVLSEAKVFCDDTKRWVLKFALTGKEFKAKTYEESLAFLKESIAYQHKKIAKGKFDDLIAANPNLRKFHGKTSLLDTKDKDYFKSGLKSKVNRGIASTWGMFDAATGFD